MTLFSYVIYFNPTDFPNKHVVRGFEIKDGDTIPQQYPECVVNTIDEARSYIPKGMIWIDRFENDDPCIVESYL